VIASSLMEFFSACMLRAMVKFGQARCSVAKQTEGQEGLDEIFSCRTGQGLQSGEECRDASFVSQSLFYEKSER